MSNPGRRFKTEELWKILTDIPYRLEMGKNAVRRVVKTLAVYDDTIWMLQDGHDITYCYSKKKIDGYYTKNDYEF